MTCPACGNELTAIEIGDIVVDACVGGCGGLWFDQLELRKFDSPLEGGEELLEIARDPSVTVDRTQRLNCPKCDGVVMLRHYFSPRREAEVDECPACAGFWLDPGELALIREQYDTNDEREKAAEEYFDDLFDDDLERLHEETEERVEKARRFAHALRFICPSWYIPGKQKWGAF